MSISVTIDMCVSLRALGVGDRHTDDIPAVIAKVRPRNGYRLIGLLVEHGQRASGIEADAGDTVGPYARPRQHGPAAVADCGPDVLGRLFLSRLSKTCERASERV